MYGTHIRHTACHFYAGGFACRVYIVGMCMSFLLLLAASEYFDHPCCAVGRLPFGAAFILIFVIVCYREVDAAIEAAVISPDHNMPSG